MKESGIVVTATARDRQHRKRWLIRTAAQRNEYVGVRRREILTNLGRPRQGRDYEHRFPAAFAIVVAVALYAALPSDLTVGSRFVVPGLELALLIPVLASNPRRLQRQTKVSRLLSLSLVGVIGIANLVSLVLLIRALVQGSANDSHKLLLAALQVWITNIIVFGLAYWEAPSRRSSPTGQALSVRAAPSGLSVLAGRGRRRGCRGRSFLIGSSRLGSSLC